MNSLDHRTILLVARVEYLRGAETVGEAIKLAAGAASYEIGSQEKATELMQAWMRIIDPYSRVGWLTVFDRAIREACEYVYFPKSVKLRDWEQSDEFVYP